MVGSKSYFNKQFSIVKFAYTFRIWSFVKVDSVCCNKLCEGRKLVGLRLLNRLESCMHENSFTLLEKTADFNFPMVIFTTQLKSTWQKIFYTFCVINSDIQTPEACLGPRPKSIGNTIFCSTVKCACASFSCARKELLRISQAGFTVHVRCC